MAITIYGPTQVVQQRGGAIIAGTNVTDTSSAITLTVGRGLVMHLNVGAAPDWVLNSIGLSVDTLVGVGSWLTRSNDTQGRWYYVPTISNSSQTLNLDYTTTGNYGDMSCAVYEVTGHNTGSMIGATATATDTLSLNLDINAANSAVFLAIQGGNDEPGVASSTGATWINDNTDNASRRGWTAHTADIGAIALRTISWTQGDYAFAIEVKQGAASSQGPRSTNMFRFQRGS